MLKKRSSAVCRKTGLMSDHISLPSTTKFINRPTVSSPIPSSGSSTGFFPKGFSGTDAAAVTSPTSILENKPFCAAGHDFISDGKSRARSNTSSSVTKLHPWDGEDSRVVGLGIVEALSNGKTYKQSSNTESRMVLFGSQLKVQIPSNSRNCDSHYLVEYGVKNKSSRLAMALHSPARSCFSAASPASESSPPPVLCLSPSEMKLSEDYTRVISHGPNPKTIHIFDTCNGFNTLTTEITFSVHGQSGYPSDDFLTFCHSCRKKLGQGKDIFMYRGEKAFCSHECRNQEMLADDEMEDAANCGPLAPP
ncbi:hypothetical protein KSP40_PGU019575 [Platanthera guangdongensis]|uniref:FLZ-type domain-containing protein n=1 Tax=Platanthera guangdongensis TaxID=2320717 RepID=A0ABR2MIM0_9ASPA